jgi:hypothetical protein
MAKVERDFCPGWVEKKNAQIRGLGLGALIEAT